MAKRRRKYPDPETVMSAYNAHGSARKAAMRLGINHQEVLGILKSQGIAFQLGRPAKAVA